jgi:hypothetical protein
MEAVVGTPEFEPFANPKAAADTAGSRGRTSNRWMWLGASAFWLLVFTIVVARAIYFESGAGSIFAFTNPL